MSIIDLKYCSLCTRVWTNSGEHRLVVLRCGHMFGANCIGRHLRRSRTCPVDGCGVACTANAARPAFGLMSIVDPAQQIEHDRLVAEARRLRNATAAIDVERVAAECEVARLCAAIETARRRPAPPIRPPVPKRARRAVADEVTARGALRRVASIETAHATALAWAPSADALLVAQRLRTVGRREHGLRQVCVIDPTRRGARVTLHEKPLRCVAFNSGRGGANGGMALTCAADGRLVLTSLRSMSAVLELRLGDGGYACAWGPSGSLVVAGRRDGSVKVYDVRQTRGALCTLVMPGRGEPVHSLCFVNAAESRAAGKGRAGGAMKEAGAAEEEEEEEEEAALGAGDGRCMMLVAGCGAGIAVAPWPPRADDGAAAGDTTRMRAVDAGSVPRDRPCSAVVRSPGGEACIVALRAPALQPAPPQQPAAAAPRVGPRLSAALLAVRLCAAPPARATASRWTARVAATFAGHQSRRSIARPCAWRVEGGLAVAVADERAHCVRLWTASDACLRSSAGGAVAAKATTHTTGAHLLPVRDVCHVVRPDDDRGGSLAALTRSALVLWAGLPAGVDAGGEPSRNSL